MKSTRPSLGEEIKHLRQERALSQEELAHELGVSVRTVARWESGESFPRNRGQKAKLAGLAAGTAAASSLPIALGTARMGAVGVLGGLLGPAGLALGSAVMLAKLLRDTADRLEQEANEPSADDDTED